ncbi:hypothetical protein PsYK624_084920 [Phanerochaete sordida]|uniref:DUF6535 domain-containing protein n=1 Tax=Phanerochaete sordida TaxID=48140 RepID=A0A9P3LF84_9APHY|nr:hypothetical protein PsYK624_084920 [Phanerochaete sordida]
MESAEKAKARGQTGANVTLDWQPVEEFMLKFDIMKVKNYAEDIDSLLTFAGLFSAVLTAFVVQTYEMLQEDDTTNLLLAGISSQLGQSVASLNATISNLLSGQNAATTTTARWINALFFLSLIFSLAAAFFGILAKQWLREYMLWNYPTDNARDNVLLRQARFDALEEWQVGAIIASVPALLELAMILFLVGVTILLWTLDTVVAIVVTVAVVLFLAVVAAFMVLPVIFRRCPYKSPTAWALAVLYDFVCALAEYTHARWESYAENVRRVRRIRAFHFSRAGWLWHCALAVLGIDLARDKPFRAAVDFTYLAQSWRDRDRDEERSIHTHGRGSRRARDAVTRALVHEQTALTRDGRFAAPPPADVAHAGFVVKYALLDMRHVTTLFHSLLWVHRACPDAGTRTRLQRCVASIHTPFGARDWPYRPYEPQTRMLTLWHLLSGATMWDLRMGEGAPGCTDDVHTLRAEIARLFVFERRRVRDGMRVVAMVDAAELFNEHRNRRVFDATQSSLLAPLLAVDLADTVAHLEAARKADSGLKPDDETLLLPTTVRRVLELMCALFELWQRGARPNETTLSLGWICAFISDPAVTNIAIHQYPGLWSSAIVIASELNVKLSYSPQSGLVGTCCASSPWHHRLTWGRSDGGHVRHEPRRPRRADRRVVRPRARLRGVRARRPKRLRAAHRPVAAQGSVGLPGIRR